jgi:hypothetical protein
MAGILSFLGIRPTDSEDSVAYLDPSWRQLGAGSVPDSGAIGLLDFAGSPLRPDSDPRIEDGLLKGKRFADLPVSSHIQLLRHVLGEGDFPGSIFRNLPQEERQMALGDDLLSSDLSDNIIPVGKKSIIFRCVNPDCGAPHGGLHSPYCSNCYFKSLDPKGGVAPVPKIIDPKQYLD